MTSDTTTAAPRRLDSSWPTRCTSAGGAESACARTMAASTVTITKNSNCVGLTATTHSEIAWSVPLTASKRASRLER